MKVTVHLEPSDLIIRIPINTRDTPDHAILVTPLGEYELTAPEIAELFEFFQMMGLL